MRSLRSGITINISLNSDVHAFAAERNQSLSTLTFRRCVGHRILQRRHFLLLESLPTCAGANLQLESCPHETFYAVIRQAMRVLGNSTRKASFAVVIFMPRSEGYSSFASLVAHGSCTVCGPSILQMASKVWCGDLIPKAIGALESVRSDIPSG